MMVDENSRFSILMRLKKTGDATLMAAPPASNTSISPRSCTRSTQFRLTPLGAGMGSREALVCAVDIGSASLSAGCREGHDGLGCDLRAVEFGRDPPAAHHQHAIAERQDLGQFGGDQQDRCAGL